MKFRTITKVATIVSVLLWVAAAFYLRGGSPGAWGVVGVLAAFLQVVALQSSKREGVELRQIDAMLDRVGERGR